MDVLAESLMDRIKNYINDSKALNKLMMHMNMH